MVKSLALLLAAAAVSACQQPGRADRVTSGDAQRVALPAQPARTVRLLGHTSKPLVALERLGGELQARSGIRVAISSRDTVQDVIDELARETTNGSRSYDLAIVPHRYLGQLVERRVAAPLDAHLQTQSLEEARVFNAETDLFGGWWRPAAWYRGRPYGYPFAARSMSLWSRGDFWDEEDADAFYTKYQVPAAPPKTWAEFQRMAEFQHRPDTGRSGTVVVGAPEESLWDLWLQYAYSFGARILDAPAPDAYGDIVVNSPEAVRATEFYISLLRLSPPDAPGYGVDDALRAFQDGRVAMGVMWHDLAPHLDDPLESKVPMRTGYEPVPSSGGPQVTLLETDLIVLLDRSANPTDAFEVMRWTLSHEVQRAHTLSGGFSARPSVYEDPAVKRHLLQHMWSYPRLVSSVVAVPTIAETDRIAALMASELSRAVAGETRPKAALDRIAVQLQQLLAGKAKLRFPPGG